MPTVASSTATDLRDSPHDDRIIAHPAIKCSILMATLFGVAAIISDGILTPAVSVISAVGGLGVVTPLNEPQIKVTFEGFTVELS